MSSLTSFESYFSNVINTNVPKSSGKKRKRQNKKKQNKQKNKKKFNHYPQQNYKINTDNDDDIKMNENDVLSQFDDNQNNKNDKLNHTKISSYKLNAKKLHRKNTINKKKNELESNLISMGYNPKNMSLMKQRKLLDKAMKELSSKNNEDQNNNDKETKKDVLDFMQNNDLFINYDKNKLKNEKKNVSKKNNKKNNNSNESNLDLEFGDVIKPKIKTLFDEETFIRTGKSNKKISDRKLLKVLKKRDKWIQKKYKNKNNAVIIDDHLANNAMKKLKGEKVTADLKYMKNKLKRKYQKKLRSQRQWKARLRRKEYAINKKLDRRDANVQQYRDRKISKRFENRISTQQAIMASNI